MQTGYLLSILTTTLPHPKKNKKNSWVHSAPMHVYIYVRQKKYHQVTPTWQLPPPRPHPPPPPTPSAIGGKTDRPGRAPCCTNRNGCRAPTRDGTDIAPSLPHTIMRARSTESTRSRRTRGGGGGGTGVEAKTQKTELQSDPKSNRRFFFSH